MGKQLKITDALVVDELRRPTRGEDCSDNSSSEDGISEIQIGDDFTYDQAQFKIQNFNADSLIRCIVIESMGNRIVGLCENFPREFVLARM